MSDREFLAHYEQGVELHRLESGTSRLEFARTKELLERFLPSSPASVLDVGGGPGFYARWLADAGYSVHLIDPVPLHVERAMVVSSEAGNPFTVAQGDAGRLEQADASWDAVLMLGPLYHLTDREDRTRALAEAERVVRRGGVVAAAAISRFASLLDGLVNAHLGDSEFDSIVEQDLREGQHRNPTDRLEWFTTAYFHHPNELRLEFEQAGLRLEALFGIEGPGWLLPDLLDDPKGWENALRAARAVEEEPTMLGVSGHLLAIGRRV
jgi:ubiquinone/menaquinone biosynthesis C-methylase UbiE